MMEPARNESDFHQVNAEVTFQYKNWKNETRIRRVTPGLLWFGSNKWHPDPQWLLTAFDEEKGEDRDFALKDIQGWRPSTQGTSARCIPQ